MSGSAVEQRIPSGTFTGVLDSGNSQEDQFHPVNSRTSLGSGGWDAEPTGSTSSAQFALKHQVSFNFNQDQESKPSSLSRSATNSGSLAEVSRAESKKSIGQSRKFGNSTASRSSLAVPSPNGSNTMRSVRSNQSGASMRSMNSTVSLSPNSIKGNVSNAIDKIMSGLSSKSKSFNELGGSSSMSLKGKKGAMSQQEREQAAQELMISKEMVGGRSSCHSNTVLDLDEEARGGSKGSASVTKHSSTSGHDANELRNDINTLLLRDISYVEKWEEAMGFDIFENVFKTDRFLLVRPIWSFALTWQARVAEAFMVVIASFSTIFTPLVLCFGSAQDGTNIIFEFFGAWAIVDVLLDFSFAIGLLIRLRISFLWDKVEIRDPQAIIKYRLNNIKYWAAWLSCTPHLFLALGAPVQLSYLKLLRTVELVLLSDSMWLVLHRSKRLKLLMLCVAPSLVAHLLTCIWIPAAGYLNAYHVEGMRHKGGATTTYLVGMVETVYQTLGVGVDLFEPRYLWGQMPIRPADSRSAMSMMAVMGVLGSIMAAVIFSGLVLLLNQMNFLTMRHQEVLTFVNEAMDTLNLPQQIRTRVRKFHEFQMLNHDRMALGVLFSSESMNVSLDTEVRIYLYYRMVLATDIFSNCQANFILEVMLCLREELMMPGDYIWRSGDIGQEMFFLLKGEVAILTPTGSLIRILSRGQFFGEHALLMDQKRSAFVRCNAYCVVLNLLRDSLDSILAYFPDEQQTIFDQVMTLMDNGAGKKNQNTCTDSMELSRFKKSKEEADSELTNPRMAGPRGSHRKSTNSQRLSLSVIGQQSQESEEKRRGSMLNVKKLLGTFQQVLQQPVAKTSSVKSNDTAESKPKRKSSLKRGGSFLSLLNLGKGGGKRQSQVEDSGMNRLSVFSANSDGSSKGQAKGPKRETLLGGDGLFLGQDEGILSKEDLHDEEQDEDESDRPLPMLRRSGTGSQRRRDSRNSISELGLEILEIPGASSATAVAALRNWLVMDFSVVRKDLQLLDVPQRAKLLAAIGLATLPQEEDTGHQLDSARAVSGLGIGSSLPSHRTSKYATSLHNVASGTGVRASVRRSSIQQHKRRVQGSSRISTRLSTGNLTVASGPRLSAMEVPGSRPSQVAPTSQHSTVRTSISGGGPEHLLV